jgi:dTDP-4-amino-4,6-dideoxy-D-galactose acyltransferase
LISSNIVLPTALSHDLRLATIEDFDTLQDIIMRIRWGSRFFCDRRFPPQRVREFYSVWLEKSLTDSQGAVLVAERDKEQHGFVCCEVKEENGVIGLAGVDPRNHGSKIGSRLVLGALEWFSIHHCKQVEVVTQGSNIPAQRLYQGCGFYSYAMQFWLHKWFDT